MNIFVTDHTSISLEVRKDVNCNLKQHPPYKIKTLLSHAHSCFTQPLHMLGSSPLLLCKGIPNFLGRQVVVGGGGGGGGPYMHINFLIFESCHENWYMQNVIEFNQSEKFL